jgi:hypothetical protein
MWRNNYPAINEDSKIIIGLGDSFTQGQGAVSWDIWEKFEWDLTGNHHKDYSVNVYQLEYEGSWVNQLCKNHMPGWTPVNLGQRGCGNRAAVRDLYYHPDLNLEKAKEKIVIFMLSSINRFDFISKAFNDHHHFYAMWPHPWDRNATMPSLWQAYHDHVWSLSFGILETIGHIREAMTWCKANNAKFMFASAFDLTVSREDFAAGYLPDITDPIQQEQYLKIVNSLPWETFVRPGGLNTIIDFLFNKEGVDARFVNWFEWCQQFRGTPLGYLTPCSHPSLLGHKVIAQEIYEKMKDLQYV